MYLVLGVEQDAWGVLCLVILEGVALIKVLLLFSPTSRY